MTHDLAEETLCRPADPAQAGHPAAAGGLARSQADSQQRSPPQLRRRVTAMRAEICAARGDAAGPPSAAT